jgi:hypothetical protein
MRQVLRSIYWLSRDPDERKGPFTLRQRLAAWRHGFVAESPALYAFPANRREDYLDDFRRRTRARKINVDNGLFDHKLVQRSLLLGAGFPQAETIAVLCRGRILMHPFGEGRRYASASELEQFLLADGGRFVVKPEDGARGADVFAIEAREGRLARRRGAAHEPFDISGLGPRPTLVERWIEQGQFWRELFPDSANSLRLLTMWTPGDDAPFIARAVQRMGTAETVPTDNWSGGGICALVDLESGRMGPGRMHPLKGKRYQPGFSVHPDSGARIEGAVIPFWNQIKATALAAASLVPMNSYAGWDIFVDAAGTPVIGEGNGNSDVNLLQIHGGLLTDSRIRRFYEATGVL